MPYAREAAGYVLSEAPAAEVLNAIRAVAAEKRSTLRCFSATFVRCASQHLLNRRNLRARYRSELSRRDGGLSS